MTEKTKTNWQTKANRFVAFLDILGFKDWVMRKSHDDIYKSLQEISKCKKQIEKGTSNEENAGDTEVYVANFSDSIIIFSKNDNLDSFNYFLLATSKFFTKAFKKQIPIKGAIAHGEISVNKTQQIYFGQPLIDAYLMEEEVNYMGIVAHNSIDSYIAQIKQKEEKKTSEIIEKMLFEEKTPLKCGCLTHTNLNWFLEYKQKDGQTSKTNDIEADINLFKKTSSGLARKYIDNTISLWENFQKKSSTFAS